MRFKNPFLLNFVKMFCKHIRLLNDERFIYTFVTTF